MFRLISNKVLIIGTVVLIGLSSLGLMYYKGYNSGVSDCRTEELTAELKGVQEHEAIKKQVMQISTDNLDYSLSKWMRDD